MFRLDVNVDDLVDTLERVAKAPQQEPVRNKGRWERTMQQGTRRHFQTLSDGGSDQSALGGSVNWPTRRHKLTIEAREAMGEDGIEPYLQASGGMKRAFTEHTETTVSPGVRTRVRYRTTRPFEEQKARKHQAGGIWEANFASIGERRSNFPFPQRQFLYWDRRMEQEIVSYLVDSIHRAVTR